MTDDEADRAAVTEAWEHLCAGRNLLHSEVPSWLDPVLAAYTHPDRHYHNLHHVAECLRELDGVRDLSDDAEAATAALLFHDCVYDPTRGDNEERSADVAASALGGVGYDRTFTDTVGRLILATKHNTPPATADARVVVDIDLSILGKPPAAFDAYERAIRLEYAHVPDTAFRAGRAKVLRQFLLRPSIYETAAFRARYEEAARQNLARSLGRLDDARPATDGGDKVRS